MRDKWTKWREVFGSDTDYIIRLWKCFSDPEQQNAFLESVREKKKDNPAWSIYEDYPISESATKRAMRECVQHVKSLRRAKTEEESA